MPVVPVPTRFAQRSFGIVNRGQHPLVTTGATINGWDCYAGGFALVKHVHVKGEKVPRLVDDCAGNLTILPGGTARIIVLFEPDFTISSTVAELAIEFAVGESATEPPRLGTTRRYARCKLLDLDCVGNAAGPPRLECLQCKSSTRLSLATQ